MSILVVVVVGLVGFKEGGQGRRMRVESIVLLSKTQGFIESLQRRFFLWFFHRLVNRVLAIFIQLQ